MFGELCPVRGRAAHEGKRARACVMHSPRVRAAGEHTPLAGSVRVFGLWRAFASGARVCVYGVCGGGEARVWCVRSG